MKANELMIGDWVQGNPCGQHCDRNNKTYYKIALLDIGNHCWGYSVCGAIVELKYDDIFPIPLTPEILKKNGFEKEWDEDIILMVRDTIIVETGNNYKLYKDGKMYLRGVLAPLYYVHQLQHALRLCGIEKEIEL